jgi:hypothetical protein
VHDVEGEEKAAVGGEEKAKGEKRRAGEEERGVGRGLNLYLGFGGGSGPTEAGPGGPVGSFLLAGRVCRELTHLALGKKVSLPRAGSRQRQF